MQAKYRIERLDLQDTTACAAVVRLHKKCFPADDVLEPTYGYWWVVKNKTDIVGFAAMRLSTRWGDTGYLWRAAVAPLHRGRGLQRRLILVREKLARKLGWAYLISDTNQNPQSANNLIKAGYTMYDPTWPYGLDNTCYWKKHLRKVRQSPLRKKQGSVQKARSRAKESRKEKVGCL